LKIPKKRFEAASSMTHENSRYLLAFFLIFVISLCPCLAITVFPSSTEPRTYNDTDLAPAVHSTEDLFRRSCPSIFLTHPNASVLFSSELSLTSNGNIYPSSSSFIHGSIDAWAQHQHLVLKPEEVWFQILTQMNFYMKNNAESLRHLFVSHAEREEIEIVGFDWESILLRFKDEIQARVKTDWLLDWIMPDFSTTVKSDIMTANVLMMGLLQEYFEYSGMMICGLPSVTLLGEKSDWEKLLVKLDHLADFGREPSAYSQQLRPILSRFVQTFEKPHDHNIRAFWNNIIHADPTEGFCGMPPYYLSGWLMGFLFWNKEGSPFYPPTEGSLILDGITYARRSITELPIVYAQAPFKMKGFRGVDEFPAYVLAGNLGKQVSYGVPEGYATALEQFNGSKMDQSLPHGLLQPLSGWIVYGPAPQLTTIQDWDAEKAENWQLSFALDRGHVAQCGAFDQTQLGVGGAESADYKTFGEELRYVLDARHTAEWDDSDEDYDGVEL
jgi:hypothetical protein